MSSDVTSLTVELLGDATSAVSAINISQESLDALDAAVSPLTASIERLTAVFEGNTASLGQMSRAHEAASATSDALTSHSLLLARGLDAVGISAGGAATRATAMVDVLGRMEGVVPGLLAMGAVLSAAFAGFEFMKSGIKDASDFQNAMRELTISLQANGASIVGATDKVHQWAIALEEAAGVSTSQSVPAVLRLVDAGQSLAGSMSMITIATQMVAAGMGNVRGSADMAESSGQRFNMILRALMQAEDGNYTALARMDPEVNKLVQSHASLSTIMAKIESQTQDAIAGNNTNAMTWERVKGVLQATGEEIGASTLPAFTRLGQYIFGLVASCQNVSEAFAKMGSDIATIVNESVLEVGRLASAVAQLVMAFGAATSAALDFTSGNLGAVKGDMEGVNHAMSESGKWAGSFGKGLHAIGGAWDDLGKQQDAVSKSLEHNMSNGNALLQKQLDLLKQTASNTGSIINPGYKPTKATGGTGYNAPASAYEADTQTETRAQTAAEKELTDTTNALDAAKQKWSITEAQLAIAVKLSTTALAEGNAQAALNAAKASDAHQEVLMLTAAIADESSKQKDMNSTAAAAKDTYDTLVQKLDAAQRGHEGVKKATLDEKQSLTEMSAAVKEAKTHYDDATAAAQKYTEALKAHSQALAQAQIREAEAANATNEQLAATERSYNTFMAKQSQDAEENTAKQTMQGQKLLAFYQGIYQQDYALYQFYLQQKNAYLTGYYEQETEQAYKKMLEEQNTIYQQDYNNEKQWSDKAASLVQSFVDSVITKHQTLRQDLKAIWDEILKDFMNMLAKMLASLIQSGLMQLLGSLAGGGGGGAAALGGSAGAGGGFGGGGGAVGAVRSAGAAPMALGGGTARSALSSSGSGGGLINPASSPAASNAIYGGAGGASSAGGSISNVAPAGAALLSKSGSLGGLALAGIGGEIIGNMIGKMLYPNTTTDAQLGSDVGGAAGGIAASLLIGGMWGSVGGPIGIALGALLGALVGGKIGSLFGDHFPTANEPDIYQTQQWGQELADLQGSTSGDPMVANGQNFTMDSWTQSQTQGKGWNILMEQFVQMFRNKSKTLPQSLQAGFADIEALWGGAQNEADFNGNGKNGMLQIGSGRMAEWTTFWQYVSAYGPAIAQMMAMYTPTDMYAASLNGSVSGLGGYTPTGDPYLLHSFPDAGLPGGQGGMPPSVSHNLGGSKQTVVNVNNYQMFAGSSIADSNIRRSIAQNVADAIKSGFSLYNLNTV